MNYADLALMIAQPHAYDSVLNSVLADIQTFSAIENTSVSAARSLAESNTANALAQVGLLDKKHILGIVDAIGPILREMEAAQKALIARSVHQINPDASVDIPARTSATPIVLQPQSFAMFAPRTPPSLPLPRTRRRRVRRIRRQMLQTKCEALARQNAALQQELREVKLRERFRSIFGNTCELPNVDPPVEDSLN